jgi:hypothetical protein
MRELRLAVRVERVVHGELALHVVEVIRAGASENPSAIASWPIPSAAQSCLGVSAPRMIFDAERAARAGLAILEAIAKLNEQPRRAISSQRGSVSIPVR